MSTSKRLGVGMDLEITQPAQAKIQQLWKAEGVNGESLRLSVVRTHCMGGRGYAYDLRTAGSRREGDVVLRSGGLDVVVDSLSAALVDQVRIDYTEGFEDMGFHVSNSRATGKCPCGHHDLFD